MTIYKKLAEIQSLKIVVEKKGENTFFGKAKYATLDDVLNKVTPILDKHQLLLLQEVSLVEGNQVLTTVLFDLEDETSIKSEYNLTAMADKKGSQGLGSAITYARRYSITTMLNIVSEPDMDGNEHPDTVQLRCVIASQDKVKEHFDSIIEIKTALANEDRQKAMEFWTEIPQEDQQVLWIAPTKGGIWTVEEYKLMKGV